MRMSRRHRFGSLAAFAIVTVVLAGCGSPVSTESPGLSVVAPTASAAGPTTTQSGSPASVGSSTAAACTAPASAIDTQVADPTAPHGLFVLAGTTPLAQSQQGRAIAQYLLPNPDVCGAAVWATWSGVDKGPAATPRYDWSGADALIAPWAQAGKIVNILLMGSGFNGNVMGPVPAYVKSQVQTVTCGNNVAPIYWQPAWESNWQVFVQAFVRHYESNPNVGYIRVGMATGAQNLIVGTLNATCLASWDAVGYETQWPAYVQQMIGFMGSLHSPKLLQVGFNDYSNQPPADQVAAWDAAAGVGLGFSGFQANDVSAHNSGQPCGRLGANWCALYDQYAGKIPLFVQTLQQTYPGPEIGTLPATVLGPAKLTGPLPPLLETALAVHTQIFEIYAQDWLLAFDPDVPGYAQYHAAYAQGLAKAAAIVGTAGGVAPATG
jgi:hypothetical protein